MGASKIAISLDEKLLTRLDQLVQTQVFPSRSKVIREAVRENSNDSTEAVSPVNERSSTNSLSKR